MTEREIIEKPCAARSRIIEQKKQ